MRLRWRQFGVLALAAASLAAPVVAQTPANEPPGPETPGPQAQTRLEWSKVPARGVLDLCRQDAPDAAAVAEHGEIWGWPHFVPYLEHPDGYKREAGGQSRRSYVVGDVTAEVEITVQSGVVSSATSGGVDYLRCDVAANQPIGPDLEAYFRDLYGPPTAKAEQSVVWLLGAAKSAASAGADDDALAAVQSAGAGAKGERIVLFRELDREQAKISEFLRPAGR